MEDKAEMITLDTVLEECRCTACKNYLSCSPIWVLPNGNSICGRCSFSCETEQLYRSLTLELLLSRINFPCQFKEYGCKKHVLFNNVQHHEEKCLHRFISCPLLPDIECPWTAPFLSLPVHLAEKHEDLVMTKAEFQLQLDLEQHKIIIVTENHIYFIIKYKYNPNSNAFQYDIKYITDKELEATCKISIWNINNPDYSITIKERNCLPFCADKQYTQTLSISNYTNILNSPNIIIIRINIVIDNFSSVNLVKTKMIDYEFFETIKCKYCRGYLVPPIFDSGKGIVCFYCSKKLSDCKPCTNEDLIERATSTMYPCRWRNCNFVENFNDILNHEISCKFRIYRCFESSCNELFTIETAADHLSKHKYVYFNNPLVYKIILSKANNQRAKGFTLINNVPVFFEYYQVIFKLGNIGHQLSPLQGNDIKNIQVEFEHSHCKVTAAFSVSLPRVFDLDCLPSCFKSDDELTVTVKVCDAFNPNFLL